MRRSLHSRILLYFLVVVVVVVFSLPFVWVLRSSVMTTAELFQFPPQWVPHPFSWKNYQDALTVVPFGRYFLNSTLVTLTTILGSVLISSLAAFSFSHLRWRGRNVLFMVLLSSLMMPYIVTLIPSFIMWRYLGGIDTFLPLVLPSWFGTGVGGAFNIFLLRQFFLTIPSELDEAAYMDGASPLAVYWYVMLPLSVPGLLVVTIITFGWAWNDLLAPLVYLISPSRFTLAIGLTEFATAYSIQWNLLMAASAVVILPVLVVYVVFQRYFIQGIALTGLKV